MTQGDLQGVLWTGQGAWAIEMAQDNLRLIAEVFQGPGGLVFADIGWNDPLRSVHPFHFVPGQVTLDEAGYLIGAIRIVEIAEGHSLYPTWLDWLRWKSFAGQSASRASCRLAIQSEGLHKLEPDKHLPPR